MFNLRCHHDSQWCVLQVCELWRHQWLRVVTELERAQHALPRGDD